MKMKITNYTYTLAMVNLDLVHRCIYEGIRPVVSKGVFPDSSIACADCVVSIYVGGTFM